MSVTELEVPLRPCTPWCETGAKAHAEEHPVDRSCWSTFEVVALTNHEPSKYTDGRWLMAYLSVYLRRRPEDSGPMVVVHSEETDEEIRLTLDEARVLRDKLDAALALAGVMDLTPEPEKSD